MPCPLQAILQRDVLRLNAIRSFSVGSLRSSDSKQSNVHPLFYPPKDKFKYPKKPVIQKVCRWNEPFEDPHTRVMRALKYDFETAKGMWTGKEPPPIISHGADVVIIGGGIVGSCIAHTLSDAVNDACSIHVVERDPPECSTSLAISSSGLYHQIPSRQHLEMTKYAADFYRKLPMTFGNPDLDALEVDFVPNSSLQLATESGAGMLEDVSFLYKELSWKHELLSPESLKLRFPWLNVDDIALGCLGMQGEGTFNQMKILNIMRKRAEKKGVTFGRAEVVGFQFRNMVQIMGLPESEGAHLSPCTLVTQNTDGAMEFHNFALLIIAAGAGTSDIINMLKIGNIDHTLPIEVRKRFLYNVYCPDGPGIDTPMVMETNGLRFRKIGLLGDFAVWKDPALEEDPACDNLSIDEQYFEDKVLPALVNRVPAFKDSQVKACQAGLIDVNTWDKELITGPLPYCQNVHVVAGLEHDEFVLAPAIARNIVDLILFGDGKSIDCSIFEPGRLLDDEKLSRKRFS